MKIGIVVCGRVGASSTDALGRSGVGREIVLGVLKRKRAEAKASDLSKRDHRKDSFCGHRRRIFPKWINKHTPKP